MTKNLNENTLTEQPVIDWLKEFRYDHEFGSDLAKNKNAFELSQTKVESLIKNIKI